MVMVQHGSLARLLDHSGDKEWREMISESRSRYGQSGLVVLLDGVLLD
jgi:hypothetical protein